MKKYAIILILTLSFIGLLSACQTPEDMDAEESPDFDATFAQITKAAESTQAAFETLEAQLTAAAEEAVPQPSATTSAVSEEGNPATAQPENTAAPAAPVSTALPSEYCNWASFVEDVTYPDDTGVAPNESFTKIWRFKNIGSCTWTRNYSIIFSGGESMNAQGNIPLTVEVAPGETIDIAVDFIAPTKPGSYISYWMFANPAGEVFGLGAEANGIFWTKISVKDPNQVNVRISQNLGTDLCGAVWASNQGSLACPGSTGSGSGSVSQLFNPTLEGGSTGNAPTILSIPDDSAGGYITGVFPSVTIKSGDYLTATIGCLDDHHSCDVIFEVRARASDGSEQLLGSWGQIRDGYNHEVYLDMSGYAGMNAQIILSVFNNGDAEDDYAFWYYPVLWHQEN